VYDPPKSGEMVIVTVPITLTEAVNLPAMFYLPSFDIYIFRCIFNSLLFGSYLLWYTLFLSGGMSRAVNYLSLYVFIHVYTPVYRSVLKTSVMH
jgi:hypothetical protein